MKTNKILILLCVAVCALSGCFAGVTPPPEPTATREATATVPTPTPTPTPAPTDTPTLTAVPPTPTLTPKPSPTSTSSVLELRESFTSPDGEWTATVLQRRLSESEIQQILKITGNTSAAAEWIAEDAVQPDGLTYHWPIPIFWSVSRPALYFSHQYSGDGCFTAQNFRGSDLWRIDLATGAVEALLPKVGYWLVISPDETTLAYLPYGPDELVLRDLASGAERRAAFDIDAKYPNDVVYKSNMIWSPDSSGLLITAEIGACFGNPANSIIKVAAATLAQTTVLDEDIRRPITVDWPEANRAVFRDRDNVAWWLDVNTGEVTSK